ncbi:roadblock/LC7 domain-containing protein [Nocardiopsis dassonvillei]|uniref:roadblock/LC7 domain-containing protein n=1 Tax=Nocardiopsis dassonvillei TaxID=2014 RepID=UPI0033D7DC95
MQQHPVAVAVVCSSDGLAIAYAGLEQERAEKITAALSTLYSTALACSQELDLGGVERVTLRCEGALVLVMPVTGCTYLVAAFDDDQALLTGAAACSAAADSLAPLLPEELPRAVGGMHLHRPTPAGAA